MAVVEPLAAVALADLDPLPQIFDANLQVHDGV